MPTAFDRPHIRIVQSRQNSRVKELRAGFARGNRSEDGRISIEGLHLVEEALQCGLRLRTVFVQTGSDRLLAGLALPADVELLELPPDVFSSAVATESPQGIAALVEAPVFSLDDLFCVTGGASRANHRDAKAEDPHGPDAALALIVIAAGLQDPGNLGTLIRSAEAFGATGLIALPGTVSHWNAKALRASSGSAFRLPVVAATEANSFPLLRMRGVRLLATTVDGGIDAALVDLSQAVALLIGNEGAGLSDLLVAAADARITIPCPGPVESLNAAVAASVLLYEASRQRGRPAPRSNASAPHLSEAEK